MVLVEGDPSIGVMEVRLVGEVCLQGQHWSMGVGGAWAVGLTTGGSGSLVPYGIVAWLVSGRSTWEVGVAIVVGGAAWRMI